MEIALTPCSRASPATLSASPWLLRALTTTCAPSPASFSTVARPILRPDPVTKATFPSSLPIPHLLEDVRIGTRISGRLRRKVFQNRSPAATLWNELGCRGQDGGA